MITSLWKECRNSPEHIVGDARGAGKACEKQGIGGVDWRNDRVQYEVEVYAAVVVEEKVSDSVGSLDSMWIGRVCVEKPWVVCADE
jgi:hypothetical protein